MFNLFFVAGSVTVGIVFVTIVVSIMGSMTVGTFLLAIIVSIIIINFSVQCHHRTPRRSTKGSGGVTDGRPLGLPPRGLDNGSAADHTAGGGGPGGDPLRGTVTSRTLTAMVNKDQGLADGAAVHG